MKIYTRQKSGGYTVHEFADYSRGRRRLRSFSDHAKAVKEAKRIAPSRTVAEVKDELLAAKEARGKSPRYVEDLRARLSRFAEAFATDIASISTGDVQRLLDGLAVESQTLLNYRRVAFTLFRFAEARGYTSAREKGEQCHGHRQLQLQ